MPRDVKAEEFEIEDEEKRGDESPIVTGEDTEVLTGDDAKFDGDDL